MSTIKNVGVPPIEKQRESWGEKPKTAEKKGRRILYAKDKTSARSRRSEPQCGKR